MPSGQTTKGNLPDAGTPTPRVQVLHLLYAPLSELNPPGLAPGQLDSLYSIPESDRLRLIYALKALEPLAGQRPAAGLEALTLTAEILAALDRFRAKNPGASLRFAAAVTLIDVRAQHGRTPGDEAEIFLTPEILHLEAEAMRPIWRTRSAGKSGEILRCAAEMVLELWESIDQLRRSPGKSAGELIHESGWENAATAKILRKLELGSAAAGMVQRSTVGEPARQTTTGSES